MIILHTSDKPDILCENPAEAFIGERDVRLVCYVRARPEPYSLRWAVDHNATKAKHSDVGDRGDNSVRGATGGYFSSDIFKGFEGGGIDGSDGLYPLVRVGWFWV